MNVSDSEIVSSLLVSAGHSIATDIEAADVILTNTCAIRENAEAKVWHRLKYFQSIRRKNKSISKQKENKTNKQQKKEDNVIRGHNPTETDSGPPIVIGTDTTQNTIETRFFGQKGGQLDGQSVEVGAVSVMKNRKATSPTYPIVGVLGCMAERLKERLLVEESVDFICGPDAYRDIPRLLENIITTTGQKQANTVLSFDETYADIHPVRQVNSSSAFISIMRGCNNMCSFCIVPFTRGRERSRPMSSIINEIKVMYEEQQLREIVLLGQNVNGYHDTSEESAKLFPTSNVYKAAPGFNNLYKSKKRDLPGARFADLLQSIANQFPELRVRFTSPHPKDFPLEVLEVIAQYDNVCKSIHLPVQSGSTSCLQRMRRGYSREAYLELVEQMRSVIPNVTISADIIAGFCGETEEEHRDTLTLMDIVKYDQAFMFAYSLREKTHAARTMTDDVPEDVKQRRLREIIDNFHTNIVAKNRVEEYGKLHLVLVEGHSTKSTDQSPYFTGRTDGNKRVIFPATNVPILGTVDEICKGQIERNAVTNDDIGLWSLDRLLFSDVSQWSKDNIQSLLSHGLSSNPLYQISDASNNKVVDKDSVINNYAIVRVLKSDSSTLRGVMLAKTTLQDYSKLLKL
jgi:MiaB/RimO family radical SAM methylthiotransferase